MGRAAGRMEPTPLEHSALPHVCCGKLELVCSCVYVCARCCARLSSQVADPCALRAGSVPQLAAAAQPAQAEQPQQQEDMDTAPGMEIDTEPPPGMEIELAANRPLDESASAAATAAAQLQYQQEQQRRQQQGNWSEGAQQEDAGPQPRNDAPHTLEFGPLFYHAPPPGVWWGGGCLLQGLQKVGGGVQNVVYNTHPLPGVGTVLPRLTALCARSCSSGLCPSLSTCGCGDSVMDAWSLSMRKGACSVVCVCVLVCDSAQFCISLCI